MKKKKGNLQSQEQSEGEQGEELIFFRFYFSTESQNKRES